MERVEKKAYAVPALKPSGLNDEAEDNINSNVKKTETQTWDVFGDFNS